MISGPEIDEESPAEHNNKMLSGRRVLAAGAEDSFLDCYKPKHQAREAWTASLDGSYRAGHTQSDDELTRHLSTLVDPRNALESEKSCARSSKQPRLSLTAAIVKPGGDT